MNEDKYEGRTRAERRHNDWAKARRKKELSDSWSSFIGHPYYDNLHQYSKNKIHCSCGMCSRCTKTNNKSPRKRRIHGNYYPSYNPAISEQRINLEMDSQQSDFELDSDEEEIFYSE